MADNIGECAARSGNEKVFKWALRNGFYIDETGDQSDVFCREWTHKNTAISRQEGAFLVQQRNLVGAVARTDLDVLFFILTKKPTKFNLSLTRMCPTEGFIVW